MSNAPVHWTGHRPEAILSPKHNLLTQHHFFHHHLHFYSSTNTMTVGVPIERGPPSPHQCYHITTITIPHLPSLLYCHYYYTSSITATIEIVVRWYHLEKPDQFTVAMWRFTVNQFCWQTAYCVGGNQS